MAQLVTKQSEKIDPAPEREVPLVEPEHVQINSEGFAFREVMVRMPADLIADDLRDPRIWKKVQGARFSALVKFDHLLVMSHDESWYARGLVTYANDSEAALAIEKVSTFREVSKTLFGDGVYQVAWEGNGFGVRRISDGVLMGNETHTTEALAISVLRSLYPKRMAS